MRFVSRPTSDRATLLSRLRAGAGRWLRRAAGRVEGRIDISDAYVNWLCFANAGMLTRGNLHCFDHAIARLPGDAPIVEIGAFAGLSTNLLAYYKRRHGRTNPVITCDRWRFEGTEPDGRLTGSPITHEAYRSFVRETCLRNLRFFSAADLPHPVEMLSDELFAAWRTGVEVRDLFDRPLRLGGPISFAYIDGDHSYACARRDFENVDRFLEPGGFVLFDDSGDGSGWEVCRLMSELRGNAGYELVASNPNYLFRKHV